MTARPLAEVLLDLENVRHDLSTAASLNASGQKFDALDARRDDLRDEFRSRVRDLTGVSWSNIDAAIISGAL